MRQKSLRQEQKMSAIVAEAREWANALVRLEARGPGDLDRAMRRVESRYGVPFSILWTLRYRAPKDILASVYFSLRAAYLAECERQQKRFDHELEIARARTAGQEASGSCAPLVRAAVAVAGAPSRPDL
jgi:hypothetical protein